MLPNRRFRTTSVLYSVLLASSFSFAQTDEPDYQKEKKLHQIYKQYNSQPIEEEVWRESITGKTQSYSIQSGDTLWDLSTTLFGDSQFWPKVWSVNADKIENPHQINPGLVVQFTPGSSGEAPRLAVEPAADPEEVESMLSAEDETPKPEPLPADEIKYQNEVLKSAQIPPETGVAGPTPLPQSIPEWSFHQPPKKTEFDFKRNVRQINVPSEPLSYYVSRDNVQSAGVLTETEMNQNTASDFQYIYVKLNPGVADKNFYAVKTIGEIKDPATGQKINLVQVQGEIETVEKVNSNENIYRAIVKKAILPIEVGSSVIAAAMPRFDISSQSEGSASAQIIGGEHSVERRFFQKQAIVFLSGQGLSEGQTYPIYKKHWLRNEKTLVTENPRQIGRVKVIRVDGGFATAVVLQSQEELNVGDGTDPQVLR